MRIPFAVLSSVLISALSRSLTYWCQETVAVTQTTDGSPMTAERYLAEKKKEPPDRLVT